MPVAQVRQYMASAVESVLTQTLIDLEMILIDDDGRAEELRAERFALDPRVRIISCKGKGIAAALNTGIGAASGLLICRVDCDDLIPPDRLARQARWLNSHPDYGAVCGAMSTMTHDGRPVADVNARHAAGEITDELREGKIRCSLCTYLLRTDGVRQVGGFRPYFITAEDIDFQLRFGERYRIWYEAMPAYFYRLHDTSITHRQANNIREFFGQTARQMQTQRKSAGRDDLDEGRAPAPPAEDETRLKSNEAVQHLLIGASWEKHRAGEKSQALLLGWRACMARPSIWWSWRSLALLAFKRAGAASAAAPPQNPRNS